jgi:hypothetical protein
VHVLLVVIIHHHRHHLVLVIIIILIIIITIILFCSEDNLQHHQRHHHRHLALFLIITIIVLFCSSSSSYLVLLRGNASSSSSSPSSLFDLKRDFDHETCLFTRATWSNIRRSPTHWHTSEKSSLRRVWVTFGWRIGEYWSSDIGGGFCPQRDEWVHGFSTPVTKWFTIVREVITRQDAKYKEDERQ